MIYPYYVGALQIMFVIMLIVSIGCLEKSFNSLIIQIFIVCYMLHASQPYCAVLY